MNRAMKKGIEDVYASENLSCELICEKTRDSMKSMSSTNTNDQQYSQCNTVYLLLQNIV